MRTGIKKYQGFLIDADNTLFDYDRSEREAFTETLQAMQYNGSPGDAYLKFHVINAGVWRDYEQRKIKAADINNERFRLLFQVLHIGYGIAEIPALYMELLAQKIYTIPYAVKILEFLSKRATLCLITNGLAYVQRNRIARSGIEVFFQSIIISDEIGFAKPEQEFFKKALESIAIPAHSILCIGDNPASDIRGAHDYGLDTCWYMYRQMEYPIDEPFPDYLISDLRELKRFAPRVS